MAEHTMNRTNGLTGTLGETLAEFLGTMVLVLFGDGCIATFLIFGNNVNPGKNGFVPVDWLVVALGWGLAIMLGIYLAGTVSGAHINPAVTLAMAARRRFPWNKVLPYWIAQFLGAFIAALILYLIYRGALQNFLHGQNISAAGNMFYTSPKPFVGTFGAFCNEFLATALLVGLIFAVVDVRNLPVQGNLNPFIIGLIVAAIGLSFGLNTGFAINPARDFGPRLLVALAGGGLQALNTYTWVPIVAPLLGGLAGAYIYDFTIHRILQERNVLPSGNTITRGETVRERPVIE